MTTREAEGAFTHGTMTMPLQEKNLQAVDGTLYELEKRILYEEKEMQIQVKEIFSKKSRASNNLETGPPAKRVKTADLLPSRPCSQRHRKVPHIFLERFYSFFLLLRVT